MNDKKMSGFGLIELVIFIVILSIAFTILIGFQLVLRNINQINQQSQVIELAQQRMELVEEQKFLLGFANLRDICTDAPVPTACNTSIAPDFTVRSTITQGWSGVGAAYQNDFKVIKVEVLTNSDNKLAVVLQTVVSKY